MTVQEFIEAWDPQGEIDKAITWDMSVADEVREADEIVESSDLLLKSSEGFDEGVSYEDAAEYIEHLREQRTDEFVQEVEDDARENIYTVENDKIRVEVPYVALESEVDHAISLAYHDRGGNSWETILRGLVLSAATRAWTDLYWAEIAEAQKWQNDVLISTISERMIVSEIISRGLTAPLDLADAGTLALDDWAQGYTARAVSQARAVTAEEKTRYVQSVREIFNSKLTAALKDCESRRFRTTPSGWRLEAIGADPSSIGGE